MAVKIKLLVLFTLLLLVSCSSKPPVKADVSLEKELDAILNTLDDKIKNSAEKIGKSENAVADKNATMKSVQEKTQEKTTDEESMEINEKSIDEQEKDELEIEQIPEKVVKEGEKVSFPNLKAEDPEGDKITYKFTYPLNEKGEWQTKKGDAGEYKIKITASDGKNEVEQEVLIKVMSANKPPVVHADQTKITVNEGEVVKLKFSVEDPDDKEVKIAFFGWMNSDTYQTTYSDAGIHAVKLIVTDSVNRVEHEFTIEVKDVNRAPVFVKGSFE